MPSGPAIPFLLYRDGDGEQRLVVLDDPSQTLTLGRGAQTDVTLDWDPEISAVHAELHCAGGEWTLADDGLSSNGTYLNGVRVSGRQRLRDGDHVRLGRTVLLYRASTSEADPRHGDRRRSADRRAPLGDPAPRADRPVPSLPRRRRFVRPASNQQIAEEVFLSVDTIKTNLRALFAKFELDHLPQNEKRVRLAECALQWGLVSQRDP